MSSSSAHLNKQREKQACLDDDYMMYTYKVIPCSRVSTHNWKLCHFSHVGEVAARRRTPSCHQADLCAYVSANKECPDGDNCPFAHNAFESWLHPDRYRTTLCSYAGACTRKFCFFAHSAAELRTPANKQPICSPDVLRLSKTSSLDTNGSVGTPNSSSSSSNLSSSSSTAQSVQSNWTVSSAASSQAAAYLAQMQQSNATTQQMLAGNNNVYFLPTSTLQQQQQALLATVAAGANGSTALLAGPPGLLTGLMTSSPQLNDQTARTAAAVVVPLAGATLATATGAAGSGNMPTMWDSAANLALAASVYRSGSTPMSATDGSGSFANGFAFDAASPQTPHLTVAPVQTLSPSQGSLLQLAAVQSAAAAAANNSSTLASLQQALEATQQQQRQSEQLKQQLLQQLLNAQQQQQDDSMLNTNLALMLQLNSTSLQTSLSPVGAAGTAAWPIMQQPQEQQQHRTGSVPDTTVQVLAAPQLKGLTGASVMPADASDVGSGINGSNSLLHVGNANAVQLQQQLDMLTFAMGQPA